MHIRSIARLDFFTRVRIIVKSDYKPRNVRPSICTSVRMEQLAPTKQTLIKLYILAFFLKLCREN